MKLEKLNEHLQILDELNSNLEYENGDGWLKSRIRTLIRNLQSEIDIEKELESQGESIKIPHTFNEEEYYTIVKGDITYVLPIFKIYKDKSFNLSAYVYIPHNEGFIQLCVSMLGNDIYGDRIYTNASYYKTRISNNSYYHKEYGKNNRFPFNYKEYVITVIEEFNKLEEVNGKFNPLVKGD